MRFLRACLDYPLFDPWFERCKPAHRDCWVLEIDSEIAGLIIRKTEKHSEARTQHRGPKILKICTFKVRDAYLGEKFGELLLKQALWFAQHNNYDLVYLTVYPQARPSHFVAEILRVFRDTEIRTRRASDGKAHLTRRSARAQRKRIRFRTGELSVVSKFYVPIQPEYHRRLFSRDCVRPRVATLSDF
ncbi:GNAT family N-acetyltransferase [Bradyrhizobium yuanmingense]|nr:GNAT family N-acetyltransferase [Bradyrhizobium yuanmingense]